MTKHQQFPPTGKNFTYLQTNRSNLLGSLWATKGIDLQSNLGACRLGRKLVINTSSADSSDLGTPSAFEYFDDMWWAICGSYIYHNGNEQTTNTFSKDASSNFQINYNKDESDLELFNGRLWSTTNTTLYSKTANGSGTSAWVSRDTIDSGVAHKLKRFANLNRLYYVDGSSRVSSIDSADAVANTAGDYCLDMGLEQVVITTIDASDTDIFVAVTRTDNSGTSAGTQGYILLWDGISAQASREFKIGAGGVVALRVKDGVCYAIDSQGRVLKYNGYGFVEMARFPFGRNLPFGGVETGTTFGRFVHFNGITETPDNTLLILVSSKNGDQNNTVTENMVSGVWELDLTNGNLTSKHLFTLAKFSTSTITDYGQSMVYGVGAIKYNTMSNTSSNGRSVLLCGAKLMTDTIDGDTVSAIFIDSPYKSDATLNEGKKVGYFVTTFFDSDDIADKWGKLWAVYRRFSNANSKIVFKYRFETSDPVYTNIIFSTTTAFTATADLSAYLGAEMEVLYGTAGGVIGHINSVGFPYTIDNPAPTGTNGQAYARIQKWIKMLPEVSGTDISYAHLPIGDTNTRIQIKCVMEFINDDEFHKFVLASNDAVTSTP